MSKLTRSATSAFGARSVRAVNPEFGKFLNYIRPGFSSIYARNLSSSIGDNLARYTHMMPISDDNYLESVSKTLQHQVKAGAASDIIMVDLRKPAVMQAIFCDVELEEEDKSGKLLLGSKDDITVRYGDVGINPSENVRAVDLLKYELRIPKESFGILSVRNHTPFMIDAKDVDKSFVMKAPSITSKLVTVSDYGRREMEKLGSLENVVRLPEDISRMINIKLQDRIFSDRKNEKFYEEVTSIVDKPTEYNRSSGTLMNFERRRFGIDNTTDSHYHPGDRRLHIFTINKEAGVTLNFCGVCENPQNRKDCELKLDFPENSMVVLKFPAYTHHKFHGEFICVSVHPREGQNILEAVQSGTLQKGFLESATVFSSTEESHKKIKNLIESSGAKDDISKGATH